MSLKILGEYTARKYGPRGVQVILPQLWLAGAGVKVGDKILFKIDQGNKNRLVLIARKKK